jgi:hypothetical protein
LLLELPYAIGLCKGFKTGRILRNRVIKAGRVSHYLLGENRVNPSGFKVKGT